MSDTQVRKDQGNRTAALIGLVLLGLVCLVGGAIAGFAGHAAAQDAALGDKFAVALGIGNSSATDAGYTQMWFGIGFAILGVVLLLISGTVALLRR